MSPKVHLITYATPRFKLRQALLGWSARINRVANTVTSWTPEMLRAAGFENRVNGIRLDERGSGFWAWKPFVIDAKLREIPDGDFVLYCDVGRLYPFKLLDQPVAPFICWMDKKGQDMMPGVEIPWDGPNSAWIKREALTTLEMDRPEVHSASPIQASFSIWRASSQSRSFATKWLDLCSQRPLVSDDPSEGDLPELPGFRGHRHDQALLSLCCIAEGIEGFNLGRNKPEIDSRHPSEVSRYSFGKAQSYPSLSGRLFRWLIWPIEQIEQGVRKKVKFGQAIHE